MQLAPTSAPTTVAPGTVLGAGVVNVTTTGGIRHQVPRLVDITAGRTLMSGIRDVQAAAQQLIGDTWRDPLRGGTGLVGFVRTGDTFDAVEMLAPRFTDGSSPIRVWAPWSIAAFKPVEQLEAVWQISPYGGDAHLGKPDSMFPDALPTPVD